MYKLDHSLESHIPEYLVVVLLSLPANEFFYQT